MQKKGISNGWLALTLVWACLAGPAAAASLVDSLEAGSPQLKSMGPLAFGPEGILFMADTKSAAIFAIATGDTAPAASGGDTLKVEGLNQKLAGLLGTAADQILIDDLAVNPISRNAYLAVSRGRGPEAIPVLIKVDASGQLTLVKLDGVKFGKANLPDAPADRVAGEGRRQANPRLESITDIAYLEGRVLVAGLANEEFASTLRAIPFPFVEVGRGTTVEIYHGAHGRFETKSPVRTFVPFNVGNEPYLLAAYTCTPLVQFPLSDLKPDAKIQGKTIAELGNRNRPLDMIVYKRGGKDFLLIANSSRGIMKVSTENIAGVEGIKDPVEGGGTRGLSYETIESWSGIDQLDRLNDSYALVVRRGDGGNLNLESLPLP